MLRLRHIIFKLMGHNRFSINPDGSLRQLILPLLVAIGVFAFHLGFAQKPDSKKEWLKKYDHHIYTDGLYIVKKRMSRCAVPQAYLATPQGKILTKAYRDIAAFSEGLAEVVYGPDTTVLFAKHGYIDRQGREVIPPIYASAGNFSRGLAWVVHLAGDSYKLYYIDKQGTIIHMQENVSPDTVFQQGKCSLVYPCGFETGEEISDMSFSPIVDISVATNDFILQKLKESRGALVVFKKPYVGMMDKQGILRIPVMLNEISTSDRHAGEGLYRMKFYSLYGFVNATTARVVAQCMYEDALKPTQNRVWVKLKGKWGAIDRTGKQVIPNRYDHVSPYTQEGIACAGLNRKFGHIDRWGRVVTPFAYDMTFPFADNLAKVRKGKAYGFVDQRGRLVVDTVYSWASVAKDGVPLVERHGLYWKIGANGNQYFYRLSGTLLTVLFLTGLLILLLILLNVRRRTNVASSI